MEDFFQVLASNLGFKSETDKFLIYWLSSPVCSYNSKTALVHKTNPLLIIAEQQLMSQFQYEHFKQNHSYENIAQL